MQKPKQEFVFGLSDSTQTITWCDGSVTVDDMQDRLMAMSPKQCAKVTK